jgi:hypothetical protein
LFVSSERYPLAQDVQEVGKEPLQVLQEGGHFIQVLLEFSGKVPKGQSWRHWLSIRKDGELQEVQLKSKGPRQLRQEEWQEAHSPIRESP